MPSSDAPADGAALPPAPLRPLPYRRRRRDRGVALILVLGSITILTVMLTEMQDETAAELNAAIAHRDSIKAEYAAKSGISLSRLLIASEPTIRKAVAPLFIMMRRGPPQIPIWEFAPQILGPFNDDLGAQEFSRIASVDLSEGRNLGLEGASFELQVVDEDGKLNVNTPARGTVFEQQRLGAQLLGLINGPQYDALFEGRDDEGELNTRQTVCGAIVDWTDPNTDAYPCDPQAAQQAQAAAPEDGYYQQLRLRPYKRKNAAFDSLDELHFIRGVDEDFWATFIEPDPMDPSQRVVTVWGQGTVNVNTANPQTILAIVCNPRVTVIEASPACSDPTQAASFLSVMSMAKGFTAGAPVFSSTRSFVRAIQGKGLMAMLFSAANLQPFQLRSEQELEKLVSAESKVFSIYSTGRVVTGKRETTVRLHAVVDFRGAPPPTMPVLPDADALGGAAAAGATARPGQPGGGQPQDPASIAPGATENVIAGAFRPDPGGTVIYFRVD